MLSAAGLFKYVGPFSEHQALKSESVHELSKWERNALFSVITKVSCKLVWLTQFQFPN